MSSKKTKVLVTIPSGFCFGLQHVSFDLFSAGSDYLEPYFLVSKWSNGDFEKELEKRSFPYSYSWLGMFSRKLDFYNLKMSLHALSKILILYWDFYKLYRKFKPDVLFFANHHEIILLAPILGFINCPAVCHMHDPSPAIPFQKRTFKFYNKRINAFIAISNNVKNRLIDLGCSADKITVIHNGVQIPENIPSERTTIFSDEFSWPDKSFIFGITGQMTHTKGHTDVLAAFEFAYAQNPNIRLVIGGKKMEPLYSELATYIETKKLENVVRFSGWKEKSSDFFSGIDTFILGSRHDEGYGLVVAEAMAHSKPAIITSSGGAIEIVENGKSGYIIPKGDIQTMKDKMLEISSLDKAKLNEMKMMAKQRIEKQFAIQKQAVVFSNFLQNI